MHDLHHLHLVKLVLANQTARVAPGAARLGSKAGRVCSQLDGQLALGQHHIAHKVGQGHFAGGDQIQRGALAGGFALLAAFFGGKQIFFKLGQLAGAFEAVGIHDVRCVALGVAVLLGLHIEHELRECAVHAGNLTLHHGEA